MFDVSSTLDLKVYDSAITNVILNDSIGKISIPLLRIVNGEMHWYALKDKSKRNIAKGNCPRVLLKMTLIWNPVSEFSFFIDVKYFYILYLKTIPS